MTRFEARWLKRSLLACAIAAAPWSSGAIAGEETKPVEQQAGALYRTHIVGLKDLPLGLYEGEDGRFPAPKRLANGKIDFESEGARLYLAHLKQQQANFLEAAELALGRPLKSPSSKYFCFQHAYNGMVLSLTKEEVAVLNALDQVASIQEDWMNQLDTNVSARFVGANWLWQGTGFSMEGMKQGSYGEGVVVGVLDSGINPASPSFSEIDGMGFRHINPRGQGNYLGICDSEAPFYDPATDAVCNSKLIGTYDFVDDRSVNGNGYDGPGAEDEDPNGHGTHVASAAIGNFRAGTLFGLTFILSGIAPRANLVAYNVCFEGNAPTINACPGSAGVAAINQAIRDQAVDVLNLSLSSQNIMPWSNPESLALLAAQNAGIFVASTAGNSSTSNGPTTGSVKRTEPWIATVGAITHTRGEIHRNFAVTGAAVPSLLRQIPYKLASWGIQFNNDLPPYMPLIVSPNYVNLGDDTFNDGCQPFPADTFIRSGRPSIALLRYGGANCTYTMRVANAIAAGAYVVVFGGYDRDYPGDMQEIAGGLRRFSLPILSIPKTHADAIRQYVVDTPGDLETAQIAAPFVAQNEVPFKMGDFSLIGPAPFGVLKPDLVAPGVNVLAAQSRWVADPATPAGGYVDLMLNNKIGLLSGTSMASPMVAGAAALIRQIRPNWTPSEMKSALMLTALTSVSKPDGRAPATAFEQGSGAMNLINVTHPGFILAETGANFMNANPMRGDPSTLNIPSMQNLNCRTTCSFTRRLKNTSPEDLVWTIALERTTVPSMEGLGTFPSGSIAITSTQFFLGPSQPEQTITLTFNAGALRPNTTYFANLLFKTRVPGHHDLRMPIVIRAPSP